MADTKITALGALTGANVVTGDQLVIVDVSDTAMAASGTDKNITVAELVAALVLLGGLPETCKQSAQVTNSSNTTATSITGLAMAVKSGHRYSFKFMGAYQSAATTTGIGFCFTGPTMTSFGARYSSRQAADGTDSFFDATNVTTTTTTVVPSTAAVAANTDYMWMVEGYCTPSADGTLQLQCRSEVNASQVTVQNVGVGYMIDAG